MAEERKGENRRRATTDGADFTDSQHKATKNEKKAGKPFDGITGFTGEGERRQQQVGGKKGQ